MKLSERFYIGRIANEIAMPFIVKYHYLHRIPPCSFAFALYDRTQKTILGASKIVGIITYGTPCSAPLRKGICGIDQAENVIELNRLWIADNIPKNAESYLIMHTARLVDKEIIISYADSAQQHLGIIYQACSWLFTGTSREDFDLTVEGLDIHGHTLYDKYTGTEIIAKFGDKVHKVKRSLKYRYIYFNCGKFRRKILLKQLKYPILSYPKSLSSTELKTECATK
jgi:hypothetical protein